MKYNFTTEVIINAFTLNGWENMQYIYGQNRPGQILWGLMIYFQIRNRLLKFSSPQNKLQNLLKFAIKKLSAVFQPNPRWQWQNGYLSPGKGVTSSDTDQKRRGFTQQPIVSKTLSKHFRQNILNIRSSYRWLCKRTSLQQCGLGKKSRQTDSVNCKYPFGRDPMSGIVCLNSISSCEETGTSLEQIHACLFSYKRNCFY